MLSKDVEEGIDARVRAGSELPPAPDADAWHCKTVKGLPESVLADGWCDELETLRPYVGYLAF